MSKITKRILSGVLSAGMILTAVCVMPFAANATEETSATGVTSDTIAPASGTSTRVSVSAKDEDGLYAVTSIGDESTENGESEIKYLGGNANINYDLGNEYEVKKDSSTNFIDVKFDFESKSVKSVTVNNSTVIESTVDGWTYMVLKSSSDTKTSTGFVFRNNQSTDGMHKLTLSNDTKHSIRLLIDCQQAKLYSVIDGAVSEAMDYPSKTSTDSTAGTDTSDRKLKYINFHVPKGIVGDQNVFKLSDAKVTVYDDTSTATLQDVYESGLEEKVTTAVGVVKRSNSSVSTDGTKYTMTCTGSSATEESVKVSLPDKLTLVEKADATEETSGGLSAPTAGLVHFSTMLGLGENGNDTENIEIRLVGDCGIDARETRLQAATSAAGFAITTSGKEDQILPCLGKNEYKLDIVMTPVSDETATGKAYFYINGVYCGESMYKQLAEKDEQKPDKLYTIEDIEIFVKNGVTTSGQETQLIFTDPVVNTYYNVAGKNWTVDKVRAEVAGDAEVKYNTVKIDDDSTAGKKDITVNIYGAIEGKLVILAGYSDNGTVLTYATKLDNTKRMQTVKGVDMTNIDSMRVFIWNGTTLEPYDTAVVYTATESAQ